MPQGALVFANFIDASKSVLAWASAIIVGLTLAGFGLLCFFWLKPDPIVIRNLHIESASLRKVLSGKKVVHISDLHIRELGAYEEEILQTLRQIAPDFVFLTGDFIQWDGDCEPALTFLSKLGAIRGVFAVMGEYDYSRTRKSCLFCHEPGSGKLTERHRVKFLMNSIELIELEQGTLWIGGMDPGGIGRIPQEFDFLHSEKRGAVILLSHDPMFFDKVDKDEDVLVLAGDTHGGQIPLPSWLWRWFGYDKNAKYGQGLFEQGRKKMFVTRGIGTSHLPVRVFCPPEIVLLNFN